MTGSRPAAAQDSLDVLVRRAAQGDGAAFARIVRLHNEAMTRVAIVILADGDAAAGAVEAAWLEAWRALRRKRTSVTLGAWLCSLAAAEATGRARPRDAHSLRDAHSVATWDHADRPAHPAAHLPDDDALVSALAALGPEDRALLALRHVAGLSGAEVGQAMRRSRPPVAVRLARLTQELARLVRPGSDPGELDDRIGRRLRAYANAAVRPVDADAVARRARAEASLERTRVVSVVLSAVVGMFVMAYPYLAGLLFDR